MLIVNVLLPFCCLQDGQYQSIFCKDRSIVNGANVFFISPAATTFAPRVENKILHPEEYSDTLNVLLMKQLHAIVIKNNINRQSYQINASMIGTAPQDAGLDRMHVSRENYYHKNHTQDFNRVHPLYSGSSPPVS